MRGADQGSVDAGRITGQPFLTVDFISGLALIVIGAGAILASRHLALGTLARIGPGAFIWLNSGLLVVIGIALCIFGIVHGSRRRGRWPLRGSLLVAGAILSFAVTLRPLGLLIACFLAYVVSGLASPETRVGELLLGGVVMALICAGTFVIGLDLPISLLPTMFV